MSLVDPGRSPGFLGSGLAQQSETSPRRNIVPRTMVDPVQNLPQFANSQEVGGNRSTICYRSRFHIFRADHFDHFGIAQSTGEARYEELSNLRPPPGGGLKLERRVVDGCVFARKDVVR
jgi:hypothetical protein